MTDFPRPDEYADALRNPAEAFLPAELRHATVSPRPGQRFLLPSAGTTAVVFQASIGDRDVALRFFTRPIPAGAKARYRALAEARRTSGLARHIPDVTWIERGVHLRGRSWPMLRMEWVHGHTLDEHVDRLVERGDGAAIEELARTWAELVARMQSAGFAHGDLQHGNVLVGDDGVLKLVDLDGFWTPSVAHLAPPAEGGHPNYQPPSVDGPRWHRWMDTFPALVIHLSLTATSRDLGAWDTFWTENNLLFSKDDFVSPFATDIWRRLRTMDDRDVDAQASRLIQACGSDPPALTDLAGLLRPVPWWEQQPILPEPTLPEPRRPEGVPAARATKVCRPEPARSAPSSGRASAPTARGPARPSVTAAPVTPEATWWLRDADVAPAASSALARGPASQAPASQAPASRGSGEPTAPGGRTHRLVLTLAVLSLVVVSALLFVWLFLTSR